MIKLKIDSTEVTADEGQTILECARKAGIEIPTLCHRDGVEHYSSCMVCMVKDVRADKYIPSCTAMAQDGMEIDASGTEVVELRKKAVELLLSEHRAECEAPCRIVCPAGYNIPLMNRLIQAGDIDGAVELTFSEIANGEIRCTTCAGYCENACRRKKIDHPVSIRNIKLFIHKIAVGNKQGEIKSNEVINEAQGDAEKKDVPHIRKRFSSRIGKIDDQELKEWLKECSGDGLRFSEIPDFSAAEKEAGSCMHCDCRASENCRLREIAEIFSLKDPPGKLVNIPLSKKINNQTGLIFENGKCIKCGLCVRVCKDTKEEPALCFIYRGFISFISEPLTEEFETILKTKADICVEVCPTGALSKMK